MMKKDNPKDAIIAITGGLLFFYLIYKLNILLIIAICLIAIGLTSTYLSAKISWLWMGFAKILGYVNSRILLGAVFFLILTPLAMIRRLFSRRVNTSGNSTAFIERNHEFAAGDFEKPF
jgi:hypothetical protein